MKAIMISDHAKWCALMMNGEKTIEVRSGTALYKAIQKLIDENGYADLFVYCTKDKEVVMQNIQETKYITHTGKFARNLKTKYHSEKYPILNGKVAFKFRCYKVEETIPFYDRDGEYDSGYFTETLDVDDFKRASCIATDDLFAYLDEDCKTGYAIHISDLEIFDKPKELGEFKKHNATGNCWKCKLFGSGCNTCHLTKAPQSFMFIEVGE